MKLLDDSTTTIQPIPKGLDACSVLIVDDDELVREQLASLVSSAGYRVRTAASGEDALRAFDAEPARILLSDWEMPDMDGVALCRNIRARELTGYTFILLLTVRRSKRDVISGLAAGADDYVVKGAPPEELLARLNVGRRITGLEHSLRATSLENRRLAFTDGLTGAYNRRFLMKHLPREYERCRRYGHPLSLLACDLDRFKLINDGYGHETGDAVLQEFVRRAGEGLRGSDWIARMGGEEFVVVLPETDYAGAAIVAERIRASTAAKSLTVGGQTFLFTVSVGYSAAESDNELERFSFDDLLRTADAKLYEAKQGGRNKAVGGIVYRNGAKPEVPFEQRFTQAMGRASKLTLV